MSASPLLNHLSIADACLSSLPSLFTCKPSHSSLHFRSNPITLTLHKPPSSLSPFISLKRKLPLLPLVAQTSDWARQEEEEEFVEEDEEDENLDGEIVAEGEGRSYSEPPEEAKLFVGNLPFDIDSEKLAGLFDPAGIVEVAEVIYNRETDQSRGFGFVTMSTVKEAERAVEMFHRYELSGRPLTVNKAAPRGSRVERAPRDFESSLKIYVGNLAWEVDDACLEQVFSEHGKVVDAKVVYDRETGRSRGFGFVTMAVKAEMNDAIAALDGENLNGRAIRVNAAEERPPRRNSF